MRHLATALLLALGVGSTAEEPCPPSVIGVQDPAAIRSFLAEVREGARNPTRLAALVRLPLRVNSRDRRHGQVRTRYLRSPDEVRRYAKQIFTKRFRERVGREAPGAPICRHGSLGVAGGLLWATPGEDGRLLVSVVNSDEFQWPGMASGELLRCQTEDHLVVIDRPKTRVRYRSWPRGRTSGRPDLVLERGVETWEESGPCLLAVWTFARGRDRIGVREAACGPGGDGRSPVGFVSVMRGRMASPAEAAEQGCFEASR